MRKNLPRKYLAQYLAISPFFLLFGIFGLFPMVFLLVLAFHYWDGVGEMRFVGLDQFQFLLTDGTFWLSLVNTVQIWVLSTVPTLFLGLVIAFVLHSSVRLTTFYRIAYFVPSVTSLVAVAIVFGSISPPTSA